MKNISDTFKLFEAFIIETIFQSICDFGYRRFRLPVIFWVIASALATLACLGCLLYRGLAIEHDNFMFLTVVAIILFWIPTAVCLIRRFRKVSKQIDMHYDEWPIIKDSDTRCKLLLGTVLTLGLWILISLKQGHVSFGMFLQWICLGQYFFFAFCACDLQHYRDEKPQKVAAES